MIEFSLMGVVNVTPDSFSDGGRFLEARAAIEHGLALAALEAEAFLVWPRLEVKRHARRLARRLRLGKLRARVARAAATVRRKSPPDVARG